MKRHTFVEINLDNFDYNLAYLQKKANKKLIAVLKANGYGSNDVILAKRAIQNGIDFFAVSSIEEALKLRNNGINKEILILGYVEPEDLKLIKEKKLSIVTISKDYIRNSKACYRDLKGLGKQKEVHLNRKEVLEYHQKKFSHLRDSKCLVFWD